MSIENEKLIYANLPYKKYRWISVVAVIQATFVAFNLLVLPNTNLLAKKKENEKKPKNLDGPDKDKPDQVDLQSLGFFEKLKRFNYKETFTLDNSVDNIKQRPLESGLLFGACSMVLTSLFFYARRSIHTISLLPNERVRFQFFSPFAVLKPPSLETSIRKVSCVSGRKSKHNYSILKLKGYLGYHLVHKSDGHFLEPKLYDQHLGYERSWVKK